ncbi:hypothetical protein [Desulfobacter latus]|uniref:Uncharacterized protein n=1 Tax=Desulfobacter latus TaxID=2292 RepID=A0A850SVJ7_9BACT|nr:hypothetical protein [Desulfobacter latus]NWH04090.1 hypothetical protein [Desulfobacter latus]
MSDPNLKEEDDDLISQDDIDKLLNISSGDDAAGELSQDDIDNLLNASGPDADGSGAGQEDAEELSQDDIDRMMAGNALDEDAPPQDDDSELSQDDIDAFIDDSQDADAGDDELISLEDIQGVMADHTQENDAADSESGPDPILEVGSNQEDETVQKAEDATVDDALVMEAPGQEKDPFDEPIDESQATDIADCMITQEAMDALIQAGLPTPDISEEDNVTQEDIDTLLQQSDETDELRDDDEDILISQEDINTLLMATDQEDDDLLGDIDGEDDASDLEDQPDKALDDQESDSSQVLLEGVEGAEISDKKESTPAESSKKGGKIKALLKSKVLLAAASILLFMGISVPLIYFLFFSGQSMPLLERQTAALTEIDLIRDVQKNVFADKPVPPPSRKSGTILLTDFIILASDQSRTMTYVSADVAIDYSDQRAYDEINNNLAFYRDLIYEAIQTRLVSKKNNEVTEADLMWGVEASLKKVLPPQYIDKISFKSFKAT